MTNSCCINKKTLDLLWDKIEQNFASKTDLEKLHAEIDEIRSCSTNCPQHIAQAAAAIVVDAIRQDLRDLSKRFDDQKFDVCVVPSDSKGFPDVAEPKKNVLYLCQKNEAGPDKFSEWIWVKYRCKVNPCWELVGSKEVDLGPIEIRLDKIEQDICKLNCKLDCHLRTVAQKIIKALAKPIKDLKARVAILEEKIEQGGLSDESIEKVAEQVVEKIPMAHEPGTEKGLISHDEYSNFSTGAPGTISPDEVENMFNKTNNGGDTTE